MGDIGVHILDFAAYGAGENPFAARFADSDQGAHMFAQALAGVATIDGHDYDWALNDAGNRV